MRTSADTDQLMEPHYSKRVTAALCLCLSDIAALLLIGSGLLAAGRRLGSEEGVQPQLILIFGVALLWSFSLWAIDAYSPYYWPSGLDFFILPIRSVVPFAGLCAIIFVLVGLNLHRRYAVAFVIVGVIALMLVRLAFRAALKGALARGKYSERAIVLLQDEDDWSAISRMLEGAGLSFSVVGAVGGSKAAAHAAGVPYLGSDDVLSSSELSSTAGLIIANGAKVPPKQLDRIAWAISGSDTHLMVVVDPLLVSSPRLRFRSAFGVIVGEASVPGLSPIQRALKRTFDICFSVAALLLVTPVFAIAAAAIYLEDRGEIFFRQNRVGAGLSDFTIFKFRSMYVGADRLEKELRKQHHRPGQMWKVDDDPRITRVGKLLRKTSLDELPQLLNVLKGDMSLVGPRPKQRWEVASYNEEQLRRFSLTPGVTGLSQVSGRSDLSLDEAVELDLEYARNWSLGRDIVICVRTALQLLSQRGAY